MNGHVQRPQPKQTTKPEQTTKQTRTSEPRQGAYGNIQIPEPEDERDEIVEEDPDFENFEDSEDDSTYDGETGTEDDKDPSFVQAPSFLPSKWLWTPGKSGSSRLVWAASDLTPRLDAIEIFRLFLDKTLNAVYWAEVSLFPAIEKEPRYTPPSPIDLEGFFLQKWLVKLVQMKETKNQTSEDNEESEDKRKQFSWRKYLSGFSIAVFVAGEPRFVQPDRLIFGQGRGGEYLRDSILRRWMSFEVTVNNHNDRHFNHSQTLKDEEGWIYRRTQEYVDRLNNNLFSLLGEKVFSHYEESSLKNKLTDIKRWLFTSEKAKRKDEKS
jgi:hypothetical protein